MATLKLTAVNGIGDVSAAKLTAQGVETVQELAAASPERIAKITGFHAARVAAIKDAASALLGVGGVVVVEEGESRKPATKKKDKGKKKDREKSKKGGGKKSKKKDRKKKDKGSTKKSKKKDSKKKGGKRDKKKGRKKGKKK